MHVEELTVGRFGHFQGFTLPLGPGLCLVRGPNEAGKSTLMEFMAWSLFGRTRKRDRAAQLASGAEGGLALRTAAGRYRLHRAGTSCQVTDARGQAVPVELLTGPIDRDLWQAVFAFDLGELAELASLSGDNLRERLFAAGLTGGRRSVQEVRKALGGELSVLWRDRAACTLRDLQGQLDTARAAHAEALRDAEGLVDLRTEAQDVQRQREALDATLAELATEARRRARELAARPPAVEARRLRAELETLAGAATVSDTQLGAIEAARAALDEATAAVRQSEETLAEADAAVAAHRRRPQWLAQAEAIGALHEARALRRDDHRALGAATPLRAQLEAALVAAGIDDAAALPSPQQLAQWGPLSQRARELANEAERQAAAEASAQTTLEKARQRAEQEAIRLADVTVDARALARRDLVAGLAERWAARTQPAEARLPALEAEVEAAARALEQATARAGGPPAVAALRALDEAAAGALAHAAADADRQVERCRVARDDRRATLQATQQASAAAQAALDATPLGWADADQRSAARALLAAADSARADRAEVARLEAARRAIDAERAEVAKLLPPGFEAWAGAVDAASGARHRLDAAVERLAAATFAAAQFGDVGAEAEGGDPGDPAADRARLHALQQLRSRLEDEAAGRRADDAASRRSTVRLLIAGGLLALLGLGVALGLHVIAGLALALAAAALLAWAAWRAVADRGEARSAAMVAALAEVGLAPDAGFLELDRLLRDAQARMQRWDREAMHGDRVVRRDEALRAGAEAHEAFTDALRLAKLPPDTAPADASARWRSSVEWQQVRRRAETTAAQLDDRRAAAEDFLARARKLAAATGLTAPTATEMEAWLAALRRRLDVAEAEDIERRDLDRALTSAAGDAARATAALEAAETALAGATEQRAALNQRGAALGVPADLDLATLPSALARLGPVAAAELRADAARRALTEARREVQDFAQAFATVAADLGQPDASPARSLPDLVALCEDAVRAAQRRAEVASRCEMTQSARADAEADLERLTVARTDWTARAEAWRRDLDAAGGADATPERFLDRVGALRDAVARHQALRAAQEADAARQARVDAWMARIRTLSVTLDEPAPADVPEALARIEAWTQALAEAQRVEAAHGADAASQQQAAARVARHHDAQQKAEATLNAQVAAADVPSVEAAQQAHATGAQRAALQRALQQAAAQVARALETPTVEPATVDAIAALEPDVLADEEAQLRARHRETEAERDALVARGGQLAADLTRRRASADVPTWGAKVAALEDEHHAAALRYLRLRLTDQLLDSALERFRRERQPEVLVQASRWFGRITDGAYRQIRPAVTGADGLEVVAASGAVAPVEALSRGTCEQLYLCLRLSLACTLGTEAGVSGGFPVLLDDVLVNFDPTRSAACARLLAELARERQVVVFTCRDETESLLRAAQPALAVEHLPRYAGAEGPSLPTSAAPTTSATQAHVELARRIEARLRDATEPLGKSDLLDATDDAGLWNAARGYLEETGAIERQGAGRGTRYALRVS